MVAGHLGFWMLRGNQKRLLGDGGEHTRAHHSKDQGSKDLKYLVCKNLPDPKPASLPRSPMDPMIRWGTRQALCPAQNPCPHSLDGVVAGEGDEAPEGQ